MPLPITDRSRPAIGVFAVFSLITLALIPVDIVDFSGGTLPVRVTPFLVLSPLYLVVAVIRLLIAKGGRFSARNFSAMLRDHWLLVPFLVLLTLSVLFLEADPANISECRLILVTWVILFSVMFVASTGTMFPSIVVKGALLFVVLQSVTVLFQCLVVADWVTLPPSVLSYLNITPGSILGVLDGNKVPRLRGMINDPTRAAFNLVILLGFAYFGAQKQLTALKMPNWAYATGGILILITISRTGAVALFLLLGLVLLKRRKGYHLTSLVLLGIGGTLLASLIIVSNVFLLDAIHDLFVRSDKPSTGIHLALIRDGISLLFSDLDTFLLGKGWGTSYVYTEAYFGGHKYGNFHSGYVTIAVYSGFVALLIMLAYMVRAWFLGYPYGCMAIIYLWVNIFYQYNVEPLYWVFLVAQNSSLFSRPTFQSLTRKAGPDLGKSFDRRSRGFRKPLPISSAEKVVT